MDQKEVQNNNENYSKRYSVKKSTKTPSLNIQAHVANNFPRRKNNNCSAFQMPSSSNAEHKNERSGLITKFAFNVVKKAVGGSNIQDCQMNEEEPTKSPSIPKGHYIKFRLYENPKYNHIFEEYISNDNKMSLAELGRRLSKESAMNITKDRARHQVDNYRKAIEIKTKQLSIVPFLNRQNLDAVQNENKIVDVSSESECSKDFSPQLIKKFPILKGISAEKISSASEEAEKATTVNSTLPNTAKLPENIQKWIPAIATQVAKILQNQKNVTEKLDVFRDAFICPESILESTTISKNMVKSKFLKDNVYCHEGYNFSVNRIKNDTTYFRCENCKQLPANLNDKIFGRAILRNNKFTLTLDHHPQCKPIAPAVQQAKQIDRRQREKINSGILKPKTAYKSGFIEAWEAGTNVLINFPSEHEVRNVYYRHNRNVAPAVDDHFELPDDYKFLPPLDGVRLRWLFLQSEKYGILGFGTDKAFELLSTSNVVVIDGTFRKAPQGFAQIVTVSGLVSYPKGDEWLQLITFVMTGKEKEQYDFALQSIKTTFQELGLDDKIGRFHTDYEQSLMMAVTNVFGSRRLYGCLFHAVYNCQKYGFQKCNLFSFYKSTEPKHAAIRVYMRTLMSIFFLPADLMELLFTHALSAIPESPEEDDKEWPTIGLTKFMLYVYKNWLMRGIENRSFWRLRRVRNINAAEAHHSSLAKDHEVQDRPILSSFLQGLKFRHQTIIHRDLRLSNNHEPRPVDKKYEQADLILDKYETIFENNILAKKNNMETDELIRACYSYVRRCSYLIQDVKNISCDTLKTKAKEAEIECLLLTQTEAEELAAIEVGQSVAEKFKIILDEDAKAQMEKQQTQIESSKAVCSEKKDDKFQKRKAPQTKQSKISKKIKIFGSNILSKFTPNVNKNKEEAEPFYQERLQINNEFGYNPPNNTWIENALNALRLPINLAQSSPLKAANRAEIAGSPRRLADVPGKGHCGYMALSYLLTGTIRYHLIIRERIMQNIVNKRLLGNDLIEKALKELQMIPSMGDSVGITYWMGSDEIFSFSDLTGCKILVFVRDNEERGPHYNLFNPEVLQNMENRAQKDLPTLMLQYVNGNHWQSVWQVHQNAVDFNKEQLPIEICEKKDEKAVRLFRQDPIPIINSIEYFPPVNSWIISTLKSLGLPEILSNYSPLNNSSAFDIAFSPQIVANVPKTGHSGYMALSLLLTGTVDHHREIRQRVNENIVKNKLFAKKDVEKATKELQAIPSMGDSVDETYCMDSVQIRSFCDWAKCKVLVFNLNGDQDPSYEQFDPSNLQDKKKKENKKVKDLPTLILQKINRKHWQSVYQVFGSENNNNKKKKSPRNPNPTSVPYRPPPVITRPKDTEPLGGNVLYPSHVMTPVHPPIYDDPDLVKIHPVHSVADDEYDTTFDSFELPEDPDPPMPIGHLREWSAKTETRFFPHLVKPLPKFPEEDPPKEGFDVIMEEGDDSSKEKLLTTETTVFASTPSSETMDSGLLDLKPPSDFVGTAVQKSKKREATVEVAETQYRSQRRRSSAPEDVEEEIPTTLPKTEVSENYETPFVKPSSPKIWIVPRLRLRSPSSTSAPKERYHEFAETPFISHTYINPPIFPGYPILRIVNSNQEIIPQSVPESSVNALISKHLALRARQMEPDSKHVIEVRETPFRRILGTNGDPPTLLVKTPESIPYEEKYRRWKEKMKKKLRGPKVPPRKINPETTSDDKKYFITYSPHHKVYQISRDFPYGFWKNNTRNYGFWRDTTTAPTTVPLTTPTTTTTTTTTTKAPVIIPLNVEEVALASKRQQIRVAAIKPKSSVKPKHLIYLDDYEEDNNDDNSYEIENNEKQNSETPKTQEPEKLLQKITSTPAPVPERPSQNTQQSNFNMIVYPVGYEPTTSPTIPPTRPPTRPTTTQKPWAVTASFDDHVISQKSQNTVSENKKLAEDDDFIMPKKNNNENTDYTDYGQSEEDLFFWKPGYSPPKTGLTKINPASSESKFDSEFDGFEINVHQAERKI